MGKTKRTGGSPQSMLPPGEVLQRLIELAAGVLSKASMPRTAARIMDLASAVNTWRFRRIARLLKRAEEKALVKLADSCSATQCLSPRQRRLMKMVVRVLRLLRAGVRGLRSMNRAAHLLDKARSEA
jgi:hypothetical protein